MMEGEHERQGEYLEREYLTDKEQEQDSFNTGASEEGRGKPA